MIGNWSEERSNFQKGEFKHNSTHRTDFKRFDSHVPDVIVRRDGDLRNQGLPTELLLHHHGKKYCSNMVSKYDEDYNGRWKEKDLPKYRTWNSHYLTWLPETNDHPIQAPPTNWGLLGKQQKDWAAQIADQTRGDYLSTYTVSYHTIPEDKYVKVRYANAKIDSTTLHPVNKVLKDLHLRNTPIMKSPESLPLEIGGRLTNVSM